jgi:hypothetical protein
LGVGRTRLIQSVKIDESRDSRTMTIIIRRSVNRTRGTRMGEASGMDVKRA